MVFTADTPLSTRPIPAGAILLVVEAVSRGSRREDRGAKPLAYAEAGIRHYWRVESELTGCPEVAVHAVTAGPGGGYGPAVVRRSRLTADQPFALDIDLAKLTR